MRFSLPDGSPLPHYGTQFSPRATTDTTPHGWLTVSYEEEHYLTAAGWPITRRWPTYTFGGLSHGDLPADTLTSPRIAPAVHGLGLLEAIPEATLRALADPEDTDQDGISGRLNIVPDLINKDTSFGRFGWKANQPSLRQQAAAAFAGDLGITTTYFPDDSGDPPEAEDKILDRIETYLQTLAPPAQRNHTNPQVILGSQVFHDIGCATCHVAELQTGSHPIAELSDQTIHPYTDLLLHDMGEDLADNRPDHAASGTEWRTPPLWGIGLQQTVNGHFHLLHDGRANGLEEAIHWHGGEAEKSQQAFTQLSKPHHHALITFLMSL